MHYTFTPLLFIIGISYFISSLIEYFFPPKIEGKRGYRTKNSLKSQKHWDFSQKYSTTLTMISAFCLIIISFVVSSFHFSDNIDLIVSLILFVLFYIFIRLKTEKTIKDRFDQRVRE